MKRAESFLSIFAKRCMQCPNTVTASHESPEKAHQQAAQQGMRLWQWFLDEGIFEMRDLDWNSAFQGAIGLVNASRETPPAPLLILHPIIAANCGATHFLGFDPRSRTIAETLGLKVLPDKL